MATEWNFPSTSVAIDKLTMKADTQIAKAIPSRIKPPSVKTLPISPRPQTIHFPILDLNTLYFPTPKVQFNMSHSSETLESLQLLSRFRETSVSDNNSSTLVCLTNDITLNNPFLPRLWGVTSLCDVNNPLSAGLIFQRHKMGTPRFPPSNRFQLIQMIS